MSSSSLNKCRISLELFFEGGESQLGAAAVFLRLFLSVLFPGRKFRPLFLFEMGLSGEAFKRACVCGVRDTTIKSEQAPTLQFSMCPYIFKQNAAHFSFMVLLLLFFKKKSSKSEQAVILVFSPMVLLTVIV